MPFNPQIYGIPGNKFSDTKLSGQFDEYVALRADVYKIPETLRLGQNMASTTRDKVR